MGWRDAPVVGDAPSANPVTATPSAQKSHAAGLPPSDSLVDVGRAMAQNYGAQVASGYAGLAGAALPGPEGQGADWQRRTQQALSYEPPGPIGKGVLKAASLPYEYLVEKPTEKLGSKIGEVSPLGGALVKGGLQAGVSALGMRKGGGVGAPRPEVQALSKEGVRMTPGQIVGGTTQRLEDAATSIPLLGDAIKSAQRRGIESFDAAAINRSLAPIGEKLPKGVTGRKAVEYAEGKLNDAYDSLLAKMQATMDPQLGAAIQKGQQVAQQLPPDIAKQFDFIVKRELEPLRRGMASGEELKTVQTRLRELEEPMRRSDDAYKRALAEGISDLRDQLNLAIERQNPKYAAELDRTNKGWANFKRIQKAAGSAGAQEGVFTPAQLQSAVKAGDKSKDKGRFATGNALMQDLSEPGKSVLSQTVPDSGTAMRALVEGGLLGGGLGYMAGHPGAAAAVLGLPALYTPMGQQAFQFAALHPATPAALTAAGRAPFITREPPQDKKP